MTQVLCAFVLLAQGYSPPADLPSKTVHVRGVPLFYVEKGSGEPLVLLHGFLHDYRVWSANLEALSKTHRVVALSRRYRWPNKPPAGEYELSQRVEIDDLVAFIDVMKLGPVHLVGHSAGANLALRLAIERQDLVRSLVLGEAAAGALVGERARPGITPEVREEIRRAYEKGDHSRAVELVGRAVLGPKAPPLRHPQATQIALDNSWQLERFVRATGRAQEQMPITCDALKKVAVRVLLVVGEHSPDFNRLSAEELQKCLPQAERAVLPTSHGLQLEDPVAFDRAVVAFLTARSPHK